MPNLRINYLAGPLPALFMFMLVVAACGGDAPPPSPTPTDTVEPNLTPTQPGPTPTIVLPGPGLDLGTESPQLTVFGIDFQDFAEGIPSLSHGDFNDDGFADILIGAPGADGPDNAREGAGEAYVIFGRPNLPTSLDLAETEQDITIYGRSEDDGLGYSVLGADVNGDGIEDILVGAPGTTGGEDPRTDQGEVYVFFGSPDLGGTLDITSESQSLTITGAEGFSRVGHAIASGDVNGDGTRDILLGAPFAGREPGTPPGSSRTEVGEVYAIFGGPDLGGHISIPAAEQDLTIVGEQRFGQFGATVAAGDVNADGIIDIIVGAPQSDGADGAPAAGAVYVFFGAEPLGGRLTIAEDAEDAAVVGTEEDQALGFPLVSGDFNADGIGDIATGARLTDGPDGGRFAGGAVYVTFGRADLGGTLSLAAGEQDVAIFGAAVSQLLPSSLASGDLNDDGADDLILGSGFAGGPGVRPGAGVAYVLLGGPGFSSIDLAEGGQTLAVVGVEAGDSLGSSVTLARVSGGDQPELILLASAADGEDNGRIDSGEIYVVDAGPLGG